jgi:hypothetical protein
MGQYLGLPSTPLLRAGSQHVGLCIVGVTSRRVAHDGAASHAGCEPRRAVMRPDLLNGCTAASDVDRTMELWVRSAKICKKIALWVVPQL